MILHTFGVRIAGQNIKRETSPAGPVDFFQDLQNVLFPFPGLHIHFDIEQPAGGGVIRLFEDIALSEFSILVRKDI